MKIVIIDKTETILEIKVSQLHIGAQKVPLRLVEMLVVGHDISLSSGFLLKLSAQNISLLCVAKNNTHLSLTLPHIAKNADLKMLQYAAMDKRMDIARHFVTQKIHRHLAHLKSLAVAVDEALWDERLLGASSVESLLGVEGSFSRYYFQYYFTKFKPNVQKGKRTRKPAQDPVNAVLSYVYTIIYNLLTVKLTSAGFEPSIAYLHTPFRSHNALSSDFMEFFRATINEKVLSWFDDGMLEASDFQSKEGIYLRYESRKKLWADIKALMEYVSKETDKEMSDLKKMFA